MLPSFSYDELDQLAGELLPERAVLSTVVTPFNNNGGGAVPAHGNDGTTVMSACQTTHAPGTPGLTGTLGLGSSNPGSNLSCTPAAISSQ